MVTLITSTAKTLAIVGRPFDHGWRIQIWLLKVFVWPTKARRSFGCMGWSNTQPRSVRMRTLNYMSRENTCSNSLRDRSAYPLITKQFIKIDLSTTATILFSDTENVGFFFWFYWILSTNIQKKKKTSTILLYNYLEEL